MNTQVNLLRMIVAQMPASRRIQWFRGYSSRAGTWWFVLMVLLLATRAYADGCFVSGRFEDLHAPEQKAAIVWDGRRETMVLSTKVRLPELSDFGWIIPIQSKSKPEIELADPAIFTYLKEYFPPIVNPLLLTLGRDDTPRPVEVIETKNLDIYRITIVRATDSEALFRWLQEHGFKTGAALKSTLDSYRLSDFFFVLAKIDLTLMYKKDIDFIGEQQFLTDVRSLDGKVIKALAALRWPAQDKSLAELLAEDILACKPYPPASLASSPLHTQYSLMSQAQYERLMTKYASSSDHQKDDLVKELSERFYSNENVQHFVRVETVLKDLEAGVANPLKISFEPSGPFFPLRISSVSTGTVSIVIYLFAAEPLKDSGALLRSEAWKPITDDLRQKISRTLDTAGSTCLTKLTFFGDSSAFVRDLSLVPMTAQEKKQSLEERQIVVPLLYMALGRDDVNTVERLLQEHRQAHEFLDGSIIPGIVGRIMHRGSGNDDPEVVRRTKTLIGLFLAHDFDVNARDDKGCTAMHAAAEAGCYYWDPATQVAQFLLEKGAEINAKDNSGETPLDHVFDEAQKATNDARAKMAVFLIRHGGILANVKRPDLGWIRGRFSEAVLPAAKEVGNKEVVDLLVRGEANKATGDPLKTRQQ